MPNLIKLFPHRRRSIQKNLSDGSHRCRQSSRLVVSLLLPCMLLLVLHPCPHSVGLVAPQVSPASPRDLPVTSQEAILTAPRPCPWELRAILMPLTILSPPLSLICLVLSQEQSLGKEPTKQGLAMQHKPSRTIWIAKRWIFAFYRVNLICCQITLPQMLTIWQMKNKKVFRIRFQENWVLSSKNDMVRVSTTSG